jgi:4-amino-4-deoxy-L-arabinose transferase-like glycosyltransferase
VPNAASSAEPGLARAPERAAAPVTPPGPAAAAFAAVMALSAAVFFFHLGSYGLWEPDEARYAEIAREMLATRDFIVPHLNYVAYIEKPPLLYWLTALSFSALSLSEFAARLPAALAAMLGVAATFIFTLRTLGRRRAILAASVLATAPLYASMAQVLTTDMLLTATMTVAMFAFLLHWKEGGRWCWLFYAAMGLGVLAKGPVGAVLPLAIAVLFLAWQHELTGALRRFHVFAGLALTVAISAPWFVVVGLREPGFFDFYFIGEHLRRAFEPDFSHGEPIWFYLPVLVAGLAPWSLLVPFLTWRTMQPSAARRFCVVAAAVIVGAFTLASAKLIPYVLPALPPLAILIADGLAACAWPDERPAGALRSPDSRILMESGPLLGLLGAGAIVVAIAAPSMRTPYAMLARPALFAIGAVLALGGAAAAAAFLTRRASAGLAALVITVALALMAGTFARLEVEPERSYAALGRTVAEVAPDATVICYHRYVQSLPFYTRKRVILVGGLTELRFGARRAPDRHQYFFTTDDQLLALWHRPEPTVLVIDAADLARIRGELGAFSEIASEGRKRAILKNSGPVARN